MKDNSYLYLSDERLYGRAFPTYAPFEGKGGGDIPFASVRSGEEPKENKRTSPVFVSVPKRQEEKSGARRTKRIEFKGSRVLVTAEITPAVSYSLRDSRFLEGAMNSRRFYPYDFVREDVPFEGEMTEREKTIYSPLYNIMPVFRDMTAPQHRWYQYWKSCQEKKNRIDTDQSYFFLYVSETVNLSEGGMLSADEAMDRLLWLLETYCTKESEEVSNTVSSLRRILTEPLFDLIIS